MSNTTVPENEKTTAFLLTALYDGEAHGLCDGAIRETFADYGGETHDQFSTRRDTVQGVTGMFYSLTNVREAAEAVTQRNEFVTEVYVLDEAADVRIPVCGRFWFPLVGESWFLIQGVYNAPPGSRICIDGDAWVLEAKIAKIVGERGGEVLGYYPQRQPEEFDPRTEYNYCADLCFAEWCQADEVAKALAVWGVRTKLFTLTLDGAKAEAAQATDEKWRSAIFKIRTIDFERFAAICHDLNIEVKEKAGVYQGADIPLPAGMQPYSGIDLNGNGVICPLVRFKGDPADARATFAKIPYREV
ncbi:MAG: hypothetical protein ABSG53_10800 [Thermoguttaceae bacterium]|jgi:hypothetical protein